MVIFRSNVRTCLFLVFGTVLGLNHEFLTQLCGPYQEPCRKLASCAQREPTGNDTEPWHELLAYNCRCDADCHLYGDCCADAPSLSKRFTEERREILPGEVITCRQHWDIMTYNLYMYMVDKCPPGYTNDELRQLCETRTRDLNEATFPLRWPVSDDRRYFYRNAFCAACNGVNDYTHWLVKFRCSNNTGTQIKDAFESGHLVKTLLTDAKCKVRFESPFPENVPAFRLCKTVTSTCPDNYQTTCFKEYCEGSTSVNSYVVKGRRLYKNRYCAECNNVQDVSCDDRFTELRIVFPPSDDTTLFPLSILINLNTGQLEGQRINKNRVIIEEQTRMFKPCESGQVYDPVLEACRPLACSMPTLKDHEFCINNDCPAIMVSNYTFTENRTLLDLETGKLYRHFEFIPAGGVYLVCENLTQNYSIPQTALIKSDFFQFSRWQTLVSCIGQIVSIIALCVHLIVYSIFPSLRNLAGKCLMCLAGALLAAQLLFLVGVGRTDDYSLCVTFACLIHYAFLAAFCWMNVMSYDIWRTFSSSSHVNQSESHGRKRFIKFSLYAWLAPLCIVALATITNFTLHKNNQYRPGYGELLCWFSNRKSHLLFFALPTFLILVANIGFYVATIYHIKKVSNATKMVNTSGNKCRFALYMKLCAIMGLTWISAFIAAWAKRPVLWYVFIILNSLQGLFICLAFVLTPKVMRMMREKASKAFLTVRERMVNNDTNTASTRLSNTSLAAHRKLSSTQTNTTSTRKLSDTQAHLINPKVKAIVNNSNDTNAK